MPKAVEPSVHIYAAGHQEATRFKDPHVPGRPRWIKWKDRTLVRCSCCGKLRRAVNCTVQVYYDGLSFWCKKGKGCKA